jgi:phosphate starvation-inducible protein PhoH and related proteins
MSKKKRLEKKNADKNKNIELNCSDSPKTTKDNSSYVYQREGMGQKLNVRYRFKWTERQQVIVDTMLDKDTRCVMIDGSWGTGKSICAVYAALELLNSGKCKQIKYLRNPIEASKSAEVGLLPGSLEEKLAPYTTPFYDKLDELLPRSDVDFLAEDGRIECNAVGMIRGSSWNANVVIVDECAGLSKADILLVLSRCGPFTRVFLVGDSLNQNDLGRDSGFKEVFDLFSDMDSKDNGIYTFELREESDIVRSDFVKYVMKKAGIINTRGTSSYTPPKDREPMFLTGYN